MFYPRQSETTNWIVSVVAYVVTRKVESQTMVQGSSKECDVVWYKTTLQTGRGSDDRESLMWRDVPCLILNFFVLWYFVVSLHLYYKTYWTFSYFDTLLLVYIYTDSSRSFIHLLFHLFTVGLTKFTIYLYTINIICTNLHRRKRKLKCHLHLLQKLIQPFYE